MVAAMTVPAVSGRCGPRCVVALQVWAVGAWVLVFGDCIASLGTRALDPWRRRDITASQWVGYAAIALGLLVVEGFGAFQRSFSPMLVRRARELGPASPWYELLLAPLFVAGLFGARPARLFKSWLLMAVLIPGLALTVPRLPYPWREAVDAGVVLGLGWGTLVIIALFVRSLAYGHWPQVDPELPRQRAGLPEAKEGVPSEPSAPLAAASSAV